MTPSLSELFWGPSSAAIDSWNTQRANQAVGTGVLVGGFSGRRYWFHPGTTGGYAALATAMHKAARIGFGTDGARCPT